MLVRKLEVHKSARSLMLQISDSINKEIWEKYSALTNSWQDRLSIGLSKVSSKYMAFFGISQISKIMANI